jgi:hypothetical protein
MLDDIRAYDKAKSRKEETFPADVADRLVEGENPSGFSANTGG